jgi:hypothetical protein
MDAPATIADVGGNVYVTLITGSSFSFAFGPGLYSEGALGVWAMTCRGDSSGALGVATFTLVGGSVDP